MEKIIEEITGQPSAEFLTTLEATLNAKIISLEATVAEYTASIADSEEQIKEEFRIRDQLKICIPKHRREVAEKEKTLKCLKTANRLALENLNRMRAESKAAECNVLENEQNDAEMIKKYSELWDKYKAEYEQLPLAVAREQARVELEESCSMLDAKKQEIQELDVIIEQRKALARKELHETGIRCAQLYLDNEQESNEINKIVKEIGRLEQNLRELEKKSKEVEEELKTLSITDSVVETPTQFKPHFNNRVQGLSNISSVIHHPSELQRIESHMSDTASINTVMYEEILVRPKGITHMEHDGEFRHDELLNHSENFERLLTSELSMESRNNNKPSETDYAMVSGNDDQEEPTEAPLKKVKFTETTQKEIIATSQSEQQSERQKPIIMNVEKVPDYMMSRFLIPNNSAMDIDSIDNSSVITHDSENFPHNSKEADSSSDVSGSELSGQIYQRNFLTPPPVEESDSELIASSNIEQRSDIVDSNLFSAVSIHKNAGSLFSAPDADSGKKRDSGYIQMF